MCVASSIFDRARTKRQSCRPPITQDSGNEDLVFRNLLLAESTIVHSHYAPFGAHLTLIQSQQLSALRPLLAEHTKPHRPTLHGLTLNARRSEERRVGKERTTRS